MADGEPPAKRACCFDVVAETVLMVETESEDAENGDTYLLADENALDLARAITGSTDDPLGRLAELADKCKKLRVPHDFAVKYCPCLSDDTVDKGSIALDYFLKLADETLIAYVIKNGKMSGRYCVQNLVHIRSTPTYA